MPVQSTVTSKVQTTITKQIRQCLGLHAKNKVHYSLFSDGTVIMKAKKEA